MNITEGLITVDDDVRDHEHLRLLCIKWNPAMQLSDNFTLEEFIASSTAARLGIDNTPTEQIIDNLKQIANLMEQVRVYLGHPIYIDSGYRCAALNQAVGGQPTSRHVQGLAADFKCPQYGSPLDVASYLSTCDLIYDQLILEFYSPQGQGWTHLGLGQNPRQQILTINSSGVFTGIRP